MMPNWFPAYTNCSAPEGYSGLPIAAIAVFGGIGVAGLVAAAVAGAWAPGVAALLAAACLAGITFCTWWLNTRLICLGGDRSAIGAVCLVEAPSSSIDAFDFPDYDTDYSFDLLLWPFPPDYTLPASFVGADSSSQFNAQEWDPVQLGDLWSANPTFWQKALPSPGLMTAFGQPVQVVKDLVDLILPQQSMTNANLQLPFTGQPSSDSGNYGGVQPVGGSDQQFLIHCEIEGAGMYQLRILLWVLFGVFTLAALVSAIPGIGTVLSWLLTLLALLVFLFGGPAIQQDAASPPTGGGWGGSLNPYDPSGDSDGRVDLVYVYGRWVYDSLHTGWSELHPVHYMQKVGWISNGALKKANWPDELGDIKERLDGQYGVINDPSTGATQAQPQNLWTLHPLLDGCIADGGYPEPPPPPLT